MRARSLVISALLAIAVPLAAAAPARADVHGVPLPKGARAQSTRHASPLGFRATVDWYAKLWRSRGIPVATHGPTRVRGVDVVRFVREDSRGDWLAVHIYRLAGKTWIFIVPRPPPGLDAGPPTE